MNENKGFSFDDVNNDIEDISSFSKPQKPADTFVTSTERNSAPRKRSSPTAKKPQEKPFDDSFAGLGSVIKAIALIVGFSILILCVFAGMFLYVKKILAGTLCVIIVLIGAVVAAFAFFPLYGIGHIVNQNSEILKRLKKR